MPDGIKYLLEFVFGSALFSLILNLCLKDRIKATQVLRGEIDGMIASVSGLVGSEGWKFHTARSEAFLAECAKAKQHIWAGSRDDFDRACNMFRDAQKDCQADFDARNKEHCAGRAPTGEAMTMRNRMIDALYRIRAASKWHPF